MVPLPGIRIPFAPGDRDISKAPQISFPLSAYSPYLTERGFLTPKIAFQRVLDGAKVKQPSMHTHFRHGKPTLRFFGQMWFSFLLLCDFISIVAPWPAAVFFSIGQQASLPEGWFYIKVIPFISIQTNMCSQNIFISTFNSGEKEKKSLPCVCTEGRTIIGKLSDESFSHVSPGTTAKLYINSK